MYRGLNKLVLFLTIVYCLGACKKWDEHNALSDPAVGENLFEKISQQSGLAKFAGLLTKSGYDKVLASSKTFTVFAPTDAALANLDAAIVNDSALLKAFVANHIATQTYNTLSAGVQRIQMLSGKYQNLQGKTVGEATITTADRYAKNGVLHVIDKMLPVLKNSWDVMLTDAGLPQLQKNFLSSLAIKVFDPSHAVQIGVNPTTGDPIYQPGTDSVATNIFWRNVYDLRNESGQYTFFVLSDDAWNAELTKFAPFFVTSSPDSTSRLSGWEVVKDLAVEGLYTIDQLPDTLLSKSNVKIPIDKSAIAKTIRTSNGIVYVMNKLDVSPKDKIRQFYVEGENYRSASREDKRGNTYFRDRYNPVTGKDFKDVLVYGHGVALFNLNYRLNNVYSTKYKAYWVALNDFQTASFTQKLGIGTPTSTTLGYTTVAANNYNEVYLGEFTLSSYQAFLDIFLTAANSTTTAANPLVCDYIRLEPSF